MQIELLQGELKQQDEIAQEKLFKSGKTELELKTLER